MRAASALRMTPEQQPPQSARPPRPAPRSLACPRSRARPQSTARPQSKLSREMLRLPSTVGRQRVPASVRAFSAVDAYWWQGASPSWHWRGSHWRRDSAQGRTAQHPTRRHIRRARRTLQPARSRQARRRRRRRSLTKRVQSLRRCIRSIRGRIKRATGPQRGSRTRPPPNTLLRLNLHPRARRLRALHPLPPGSPAPAAAGAAAPAAAHPPAPAVRRAALGARAADPPHPRLNPRPHPRPNPRPNPRPKALVSHRALPGADRAVRTAQAAPERRAEAADLEAHDVLGAQLAGDPAKIDEQRRARHDRSEIDSRVRGHEHNRVGVSHILKRDAAHRELG